MDSADVASGKSVFEVAKPDIIVQITKHALSNADLFEVTAVKPNYPTELLEAQVDKICSYVGVPARGVRAGTVGISNNPGLASTRATFATNGVIDREKGVLRVGPIIQGFAGAPEPYTVHGMMILFNGERPSPSVLHSYNTAGLRLQAIALDKPPAVEYRVQLLSQDAKLLAVPDFPRASEQKPPQSASLEQHKGFDWLLWIPLGTAALAAGILVYFLTLNATTKTRR